MLGECILLKAINRFLSETADYPTSVVSKHDFGSLDENTGEVAEAVFLELSVAVAL
jgi:hypothetical protein